MSDRVEIARRYVNLGVAHPIEELSWEVVTIPFKWQGKSWLKVLELRVYRKKIRGLGRR